MNLKKCLWIAVIQVLLVVLVYVLCAYIADFNYNGLTWSHNLKILFSLLVVAVTALNLDVSRDW